MAETGIDKHKETRQRAERRDRAVRALGKVCDHLGLTGERRRELTTRGFDSAAAEMELGVSSSQVVRAWSSWRAALDALVAEEPPVRLPSVPQSPGRRTEGQKLRAAEQAIRAWLATEPANFHRDSYNVWARSARPAFEDSGRWLPTGDTITGITGLRWRKVVEEVQAGEAARAFAVAKSRQREAARTRRGPTLRHDKGRLAARLKAARDARGWHQEDLANRADLPQGTICKLELGYYSPNLTSLVPVVTALDVSYDLLLCGTNAEFEEKIMDIQAATARAAQSSSAGSSR